MEVIIQVVQLCIIPLLGILTKYLISFLNAKKNELDKKTDNQLAKKYSDLIYDIIVKCVLTTNQTYVDNLKKTDQFTIETQKEAFGKTLEAVKSILNNETKKYIESITDDVEAYLTTQIESAIKVNK